jgi:translation elongation factor EF-Ts
MKSNALKLAIIFAAIAVVIGLSVAIYLFNKPHMNVAAEKPAYTLSAAELYKEFATNETLANQKYLSDKNGKIIQVSGLVADIIAQGDTAVSISIKDSTMAVGDILCSVGKSEVPKAGKFKVGDKIVLKGECTGYMDLTNEVSLSKCIVIE